ncbi:hypothetical protein BKA58DRAFT_399423 [Alternaria rosae]|uniref:uncharacterized protein n=1 Tax=Alternaria rosae TaxID=1187941 RepID=UPI001E8E0F11|nr:uncharacterized protein BKA58DRAFT_399423 [Alternaria rosae]KAH6875197.1 hypothetical protein BKA58DRAFT_399423 [Alternaria rosae]
MYIQAVTQVVAQSRTISAIDMDLIPLEEREQSMVHDAGPELQVSFSSVLEKLQEIAITAPDRVAIKDERNHKITYVDLIRRAIAMSSDLKKHEVARGTPVCVLGPPTVDFLCSVVAIWCAGGVYVPVDHRLSIHDNLPIAKNSNTVFCIVSMPYLLDYALKFQLGTVFCCGDMVFTEGFDNIEEPLPDDLAVELHLQSFDGLPKGVILTHENLEVFVASTAHYFEDEKPVVLQHSNWTSEMSLFQILFALTSGGTLFVAADSFPANVTKVMLASFFGATETTIASSMGFVDYKAYAANKEGQLIPMGNPLPNNKIWVGNHLGRPLPVVWTGDIWVAGPGIGMGYFGSKCFRTGDWGFINNTGVLFVTSRRLDESIAQVGGFHIELGDVSRTIIDQAKGRVEEAVTVLQGNEGQEEPQILAIVVMTGTLNAASRRYLQKLLRGLNLPVYMRPTRAVVWKQLPRTSGGKFDRHAVMATAIPDTDIIRVM